MAADDGRSTRDVRRQSVRASLRRWVAFSGAQLLVVDPDDDGGALADALAARGVDVHWVRTTTDGLVEFGRTDPVAVVVAPECAGIPPAEFVDVIRRLGASYVLAAGERGSVSSGVAGPDSISALMAAGASAVVQRPYVADRVWELMTLSPRSVSEHALVSTGPLELDATAFTVRVNGERIADLPLKEFEMLRALMLAAPGVVTDDELRDALWGADGRRPGSNTIAMHATRLRSRLGDAAAVRRVRGRGYSLTVG